MMIKRGSWISRAVPKLRLRALNKATINDISTMEFLNLIKSLKSEGWHIANEYYNGGVLYHYSKINLTRNSRKLDLEWNNKKGGCIEGNKEVIREIACARDFIEINNWQWSQRASIAA